MKQLIICLLFFGFSFSVYALEDGQTSRNTDSIVTLHIQLDRLARENQTLVGRLDEVINANEELKKELKRLSVLVEHLRKDLDSKHQEALATISSSQQTQTNRVDEDEGATLYQDAKSALSTLNYQQAITLFDQYLEQYPNGGKINETYYWLARSLLLDKQYQRSIDNYTLFIEASPEDVKLVKAYYNMAQAYGLLGNTEQAQAVYNTIIKNYPDSSYTAKAKERLN